MTETFVGHPDGTVDPPGRADVYDEAFEESAPTMSAADWNADCADTQYRAWAASDLPPVSPAQEDRRWSGEVKVAAVAVTASFIALAIVVVVILVVRLGGGDSHNQAITQTVMASPPVTQTVTAAPPTQTQTVTAAPPMPTSGPTPQIDCESSLSNLREQASIDGPVLNSQAVGRWMPQLSSKRPGTRDDGITWDCNSIWAEHQRLRSEYEARLMWSGDWRGTFKQPDYWVTVAGITYPTASGAQSWCDTHALDSDHCFPTLIR